ncbi:MAG: NADH-quinone oxidoreductase subunit C [Nitrosopumilus sp.]|nr:NADH-quinone oxidoreductase subunit C [Nitrosopumilus sp.]MDA7943810.1 NADH-quinone oxidoreductase subunit C [Nitrosopumilus sp.]MDA7999361.1 NADH-quinone oxidoreductase subunit C [Nitrosopumilus sp.]
MADGQDDPAGAEQAGSKAGEAAPKPAEKPAAAKPAEKPAEKPADSKPAEKPAAAKPAEKPADSKPAEKTEAKPPAKPAEKPPAKTAEKPAAAKPPAKPAAKPPAKPAAKPEPEPPAFEKGISERIASKFGDRAEVKFVKEGRIGVSAGRDDVHDVLLYVRDELGYDHAESVAGVDYPQDGEIEVVYHLGSYTDPELAGQVLSVSTRAKREEVPIPGSDGTRLPSMRDVFYSVEFHEREVFEMLGVYFEGHPDNRRLLLPEDWADLPPLRKDFAIKGR